MSACATIYSKTYLCIVRTFQEGESKQESFLLVVVSPAVVSTNSRAYQDLSIVQNQHNGIVSTLHHGSKAWSRGLDR